MYYLKPERKVHLFIRFKGVWG